MRVNSVVSMAKQISPELFHLFVVSLLLDFLLNLLVDVVSEMPEHVSRNYVYR